VHELPHPVQCRLLLEAVPTVNELQGFSVRFYQNENLPLASLFLSVADFGSVWKQASSQRALTSSSEKSRVWILYLMTLSTTGCLLKRVSAMLPIIDIIAAHYLRLR